MVVQSGKADHEDPILRSRILNPQFTVLLASLLTYRKKQQDLQIGKKRKKNMKTTLLEVKRWEMIEIFS